jgi:hypothetical protein
MSVNTNNIGAHFATKGDILSAIDSAVPQVIPVGLDGYYLTSNSLSLQKVDNQSLNVTALWTPTIAGSSTAGTAIYTVQQGLHSAIGNLVHVWGVINFNTFTGTGDLLINLPFPVHPTNPCQQVNVVIFDGTYTSGDNIVINALPNTTTANLLVYGSGVSAVIQQCVSSANMQFFIYYSPV